MAEYVNGLKGREHWRPFAPVILDTYFSKVFAVDEPNTLHRYMLSTESVRPWYQRKYPSIVAQDGTSRPQVLYDVPENATLYHFMENYNLPILLNTSMNGPGEPICETLDEACRFVAGTPIHLIFVQGGRFFYIDVTDTSL
jgi:carbamoyltransferase